MSKKSKSSFGNLLAFVGAILAIVAVVMVIVLPLVSSSLTIDVLGKEITTTTTYGGFGLIFGGSITTTVSVNGESGDTDVVEAALNTLVMIAFLVTIIGALGLIAGAITKKKLLTIISSALLIVAGILFFSSLGSSVTALCSKGLDNADAIEAAVKLFNETMKPTLGLGAILGGIASVLGGALGAVGSLKM